MTKEEIAARYNIPSDILEEYRALGLCDAVREVMADWQYGDEDIRRLSMLMTLHDAGLSAADVKTYMQLWIRGEGTRAERLALLERIRAGKLDEIHFHEAELARIDYLRYRMKGASK